MKPWNTWLAGLGCAGLCLVLVGCGGSKGSDQGNDPPVVIETLPPQNAPPPPETATPAPVAEAAPAAATPPTTPAEVATPAVAAEATPRAADPAAPAVATAEAMPTPAAPAVIPPAATATSATPAVESSANVANNPFAVFSETQSTAPAPAQSGATASPAVASTPEAAPAEAATAAVTPPPEESRAEDALAALNAAAGDRGTRSLFYTPVGGAMAFLAAVKGKDLNKIAEATALHAPYEARAGNQKVFDAILKKELLPEDLDEFAKKLDGFQYAGTNAAKSTGQFGVIVSKQEGTSLMRRTITMRHEKAGWKVQDISGQGEIEKPIIMPRMRGSTGGRR